MSDFSESTNQDVNGINDNEDNSKDEDAIDIKSKVFRIFIH